MSEIAKDRLLAVGARFASYEHANKDNNKSDQSVDSGATHSNSQLSNNSSSGSGKMSFWKKNSGKVPGR